MVIKNVFWQKCIQFLQEVDFPREKYHIFAGLQIDSVQIVDGMRCFIFVVVHCKFCKVWRETPKFKLEMSFQVRTILRNVVEEKHNFVEWKVGVRVHEKMKMCINVFNYHPDPDLTSPFKYLVIWIILISTLKFLILF